jgi:hypothetical protein
MFLNQHFNINQLQYSHIELIDNNITAILMHPDQSKWHMTLDMFESQLCADNYIPPSPDMDMAIRNLYIANNEGFQIHLNCYDHAWFMRAEILEKDLYAITFHENREIPDPLAVKYILSKDTLSVFKQSNLSRLYNMQDCPYPDKQFAANHNLGIIKLLTENAFDNSSKTISPYINNGVRGNKPPYMNGPY